MMKDRKITLRLSLIVLALICAVYNICIIILCGVSNHSTSFILSWIFMNFSMIVSAIVLYYSKGQNWEARFLGYPILKYSAIYLLIEFIIATLSMVLGKIAAWEIVFVIQFVLLTFYIIITLSLYVATDKILDIKSETDKNTYFTRSLSVDAEMLTEKCHTSELKEKLINFADDARHSDYYSHPELNQIEDSIKELVKECDNALTAGNNEYAAKVLDKAQLLLTERNKKCKMLRK